LPAEVLDRPKQGFSPPLRTWHAALFAAYGDQLREGRLVEAGVLSRAGAAELASGPFPDGAVAPFSFRALVLETWLRGMQALVPQQKRAAENTQRARTLASGCVVEVC
jgi:asparagine synthase (glutamine-hydrolysing)